MARVAMFRCPGRGDDLRWPTKSVLFHAERLAVLVGILGQTSSVVTRLVQNKISFSADMQGGSGGTANGWLLLGNVGANRWRNRQVPHRRSQ